MKSSNKSTVTASPGQGPRLSAGDPIVALWVPALRFEAALPDLATFEVGREQVAVCLAHDSISRRHWRVERRPEGIHVTDLDSKNGTWIAGAEGEARAGALVLTALAPIKIGQLRVWPLTQALRDARRRLAHYLGHGADADRLVLELLADAVGSRSFVVYGELGREPGEVVAALIGASPRRIGRRCDVSPRTAPTTITTIRDLAAANKRGLVTVELEVLARAGERTCLAWQTTLADPQWDLMVVWHGGPRIPDWPGMPRPVLIPPVAARMKAGEGALLIDYLMRSLGAGWSMEDLARVELFPSALVAYPWPDNYAELRLMVTYGAARLGGQSHATAARTLNIERGRLTRMAMRWAGR